MFNKLNLTYLIGEEKESIEKLCAKFADIFHIPVDKLSVTNIYKQLIKIKPNKQPVYVKPYRLPQSQKEEINGKITQRCENGIIERAQSALLFTCT